MQNNDEKRQETRLSAQETLFLELSLPNASDQSPQVMICSTIDISANGVQVAMDHYRLFPLETDRGQSSSLSNID